MRIAILQGGRGMIHRCTTCGVMITSYSKTGRCNRHRLSDEQLDQYRARCDIGRHLTAEKRADPAYRAKIGQGVSDARMAWCPRYLRAEYLGLAMKKIPASERRAIILAHHEHNLAKGLVP